MLVRCLYAALGKPVRLTFAASIFKPGSLLSKHSTAHVTSPTYRRLGVFFYSRILFLPSSACIA